MPLVSKFFLHKKTENIAEICIVNSMICSDIWHKYQDNFEISRVVFMPNITYKSCYYLFIPLPAKGL